MTERLPDEEPGERKSQDASFHTHTSILWTKEAGQEAGAAEEAHPDLPIEWAADGREVFPNGTLLEREPLRCRYNGLLLYRLTYISEGLRVKGYLAVPEAASASDCFPGLIYCRGGIRKVGMVRKRRILSMAKRGYAVFAPFYRGNEGGEGREDFGGEDRYDVLHAITLVQSLPEVKPGKVPLIGFSRGALMAMLAARQCDQAGPVVVWGGVSDLLDTYEERVDLRRMLKRVVGHPRKQIDAYKARSPVYWLQELNVPILIVHGTADTQVSVSHARKLAEGLEQAGKDYAMELYDGLEHRFPRDADEKALDAVFEWITVKLEKTREA
ncbi:alpha/beta hydrolase family protein [Paenibacillus sp. OAS669]|uniref:alpha/beta hydrolase family protein n=1 Tax=Paenibacillus sp. OAS669 TaxID=2663821 RepID=UPI00178A0ED0|nr:prolyl oligopeptidase family serine peptidase [Paenibacillus sp. OAS669]MBE1445038.1 dipeptidyl aminopeptidase/acylaminoacyl peptidase [Paenibacillus sp. OAS669]